MNEINEKISALVPEIVQDNKGALVGALIGYLLLDDEKTKQALIGAIAGSLFVDKKDDK
jgi:hypothetical protein